MKEVWKQVIGYEGWYSISNLGRVRRDMPAKETYVGKILKPSLNGWGYNHVKLSNRKLKTKKICTMVAECFLGSRPDGLVLNHKNGIKTDDRPENLEYVTQSANVLHAYKVLGIKSVNGERNGQSKLTEKYATRIKELYSTGKFYQRELADMFGVHIVTISDLIRGVTWKHIKNPQKTRRKK